MAEHDEEAFETEWLDNAYVSFLNAEPPRTNRRELWTVWFFGLGVGATIVGWMWHIAATT